LYGWLFLTEYSEAMNNNKASGDKGEEIAAVYPVKNGYQMVERNWRLRHWEIDIIPTKGRFLHFIEVKTRKSLR